MDRYQRLSLQKIKDWLTVEPSIRNRNGISAAVVKVLDVDRRYGSTGMKRSKPPSSYQRLDLFIKVLRVLCPNLSDSPPQHLKKRREDIAAVGQAFLVSTSASG